MSEVFFGGRVGVFVIQKICFWDRKSKHCIKVKAGDRKQPIVYQCKQLSTCLQLLVNDYVVQLGVTMVAPQRSLRLYPCRLSSLHCWAGISSVDLYPHTWIMFVFLFLDESNKGNKSKNKKSPFNFFKRGKDDKNNNTTPPGKLFGHPLQDVMQDGQLPKPVMVSLISRHNLIKAWMKNCAC